MNRLEATLIAARTMADVLFNSRHADEITKIIRNPEHKHYHSLVEWVFDSYKNPGQVWQATRKDGSWMDLDAGQEPRWFESRDYRRKPEAEIQETGLPHTPVNEGLPGDAAKREWLEDQRVPQWQATRKDGTWMDITPGTEPRWFESRRYRRKPQ
jgi:hypothetical protein